MVLAAEMLVWEDIKEAMAMDFPLASKRFSQLTQEGEAGHGRGCFRQER